MKTIGIKLAFLVLLCGVVAFEVWHFRGAQTPAQQSQGATAPKNKPDFVLLPASELATFASLTETSKSRIESWEPTVGDMNDIEANLAQIAGLSNSDPDVNRHIDRPDEYYRQYLAVVINGKKKLFVNALCSVDQDPIWRKRLDLVADGGKCFWHAMYDPSTQKFSDLTVNGRA